VAAVSDRKERLFRDAIRGHAQPLPGVRAWLERLAAAGTVQAIASSAPQANIDALVDELNLRAYFAALVSGEHLPGKPDPAVFLEAARRLDVSPVQCIVVEDAPVGVESAHRAGMKCIAVATTRPPDALQAADLIVERLDALPENALDHLFKHDINK
jgi:HAD superfamily hydrolase (TIGR01509 family)